MPNALQVGTRVGPLPAPIRPLQGTAGPRRVREVRLAPAAFACVVAMLAGGVWMSLPFLPWARPAHFSLDSNRRVVAVLPFTNGSPDRLEDHVASGVTDEVHGQLSKISALRVLSRRALERYGRDNPRRIADDLGAGSIVAGSVTADEERVHLTVNVLDARTGRAVWSGAYDKPMPDILGLWTEVALSVARALNVGLSPDERRRIEQRPTDNVAAYALYLRSQPLLPAVRAQNETAIALLRQAVTLDPSFAVARAGMAYRLSLLGYSGDAGSFAQGLEAAHEALRIDPGLAPAQLALARIYKEQGRVDEARVSFLRALELDPSSAEGMFDLSSLQTEVGRLDEALLWAARGFRLAPTEADPYVHIGAPLVFLGEDDVAERWLNDAELRFPESVRVQVLLAALDAWRGRMPRALLRTRQLVDRAAGSAQARAFAAELSYAAGSEDALAQAEGVFRSSPETGDAAWFLFPESPRIRYAYLLRKHGNPDLAAHLATEALAWAEQALREGNQLPRVPLEIAAVHSLRGETAAALEWLERARSIGLNSHRALAVDPVFEGLRSDPRFSDLLGRMDADVSEMRRRANVTPALSVFVVASR